MQKNNDRSKRAMQSLIKLGVIVPLIIAVVLAMVLTSVALALISISGWSIPNYLVSIPIGLLVGIQTTRWWTEKVRKARAEGL